MTGPATAQEAAQEQALRALRGDRVPLVAAARSLDRARESMAVDIVRAQDAGLTYRQIAEASGYTVGRIHQIVKERKGVSD